VLVLKRDSERDEGEQCAVAYGAPRTKCLSRVRDLVPIGTPLEKGNLSGHVQDR